ncbi:36041_t:CDS:2 [Gigaspora margarita]|uniref:36041_t:CDS:1 n=1 Tax=Gigaspora margarita TaxID=4874 RepID=A0ABN7VHF6_GIGMA|nr:36041_t:CDS:2 [Gigaspora margarita]
MFSLDHFHRNEPSIFMLLRALFILLFITSFTLYWSYLLYKQHIKLTKSNLAVYFDEIDIIFPDSNFSLTEFYNTSTSFYNNSTEFYNPYGSRLNIANITCYDFTSSKNFKSCNNHIISNISTQCWAFSPFQNRSNQECNDAGNNCIIKSRKNDLGLNYVIFNIISDTSPLTSPVSDYFSIMFNNVYVYNETNKTTQNNIAFNIHPFNKGKLIMLEFSIRTRSKYDSLFIKGFGIQPTNREVFVDTEIKEIQQAENTSNTVLLLKPKNNTIYDEEETFEFTSGVYILLFGSSKLSPWGLTQKYMCCLNLRKKFEIETATHYVSKAGIPFADNPCELPEGATIEDRILILESVLRKYYLDTDYFAELNYIVQQNQKYKKKFNIKKIDEE